MRRRLDRQERVREALLLDLGAIIFELHRQERREPEVLQAKAAELVDVDDEVRAITEALGEGHGLPELTATGLVATCTACGGIMGVRDRHCSSCGAAAGADAEGGPERPPLEEPSYEDEEFAVHQATDRGEDDEQPVDIEDGETDTDERDAVEVGGNGASPPAYATLPPQPSQAPPAGPRSRPEALVPRAQRTLRAGRRLARNWIDERRASRR